MAFTLYSSLSSGRKLTCSQVRKLTQTTWGKYRNSLSSSEDFPKYCCFVVILFICMFGCLVFFSQFLRKHCCVPHSVLHLLYRLKSAQNTHRQIPCCFGFDPSKPVSSIFAHVLNITCWNRVWWGPARLCYVRGTSAAHFQRGGMPSEGGQGAFCGSQQGSSIWKNSHSCWLLISCPQSTNNARHMMYGFDSLTKKEGINPLQIVN